MITDNTVEQTNLYFQQNLVGKVFIDLSKYLESRQSRAFNENDILSCISYLCLLFYTT